MVPMNQLFILFISPRSSDTNLLQLPFVGIFEQNPVCCCGGYIEQLADIGIVMIDFSVRSSCDSLHPLRMTALGFRITLLVPIKSDNHKGNYRACYKMLATRPKTMQCLHPADVGAANGRPRATNRRPYIFYKTFSAFCNTPSFVVMRNTVRRSSRTWR